MENTYITIGPITLSLATIVTFILGMLFMRLCMWNAKRVKTEVISEEGDQYRFDSDDRKDIEEKMRKMHPKYTYILSVTRLRRLTSGISSFDNRIYEVKYI